MNVAVRNIPRVNPDVVARLERAGVATAHEAQGRTGLLQPHLRPIIEDCCIAGSAVTVLAQPGDNWMLHVAIEMCMPGDILVVACTTDNSDGMLGDLLATSLQARGVKGVVIDAGCRDVSTLRKMRFPVWSRAISAKGTVKATLGSVNVPVVCAGALINPGDVIVADQDGVVSVLHGRAEAIAGLCEQRMDIEESKRQRLATGELGLDIYQMREKLKQAGLVYVDAL